MPNPTAVPKPLDKFGELIMHALRDTSIELCKGLTEANFTAPNHQAMQRQIAHMSDAEKDLLVKCVTYCIDGGINDFLYDLDKACREATKIQLSVDDQNIAEQTDALHREVHGPEGWKTRFSEYTE